MTISSTAKISRSPREQDGQNLPLLQQQALNAIQQYAGETWTDHNPTDPGVTLLEVLTFVISDLSYRLGFPIRDLMAWPPAEQNTTEPFWLAPEVLPSNCVTLTDYQRAILDVPGIRAVFLAANHDSGRYTITIDTDDRYPVDSNHSRLVLARQVRHRFISERNVNDDIGEIHFIGKHPVTLNLELVFGPLADPITTLAEVMSRCQRVISPTPDKLLLEQLLDAGLSADEAFEGPAVLHGMTDSDSLVQEAFPERIYASDIIAVLDSVPSLSAIRKLTFSDPESDTQESASDEVHWRYPEGNLSPGSQSDPRAFTLDLDTTIDALRLEIDGQGYPLSQAQKGAIVEAMTLPLTDNTALVTASEMPDLHAYQQGRYRDLNHYYSLQHEFPAIYQLVDDRLNGEIDSPELAQVMQLKGFLMIFDQILADQFAQLETLKSLLALPGQQCFKTLAGMFDKMLASESLSESDTTAFWQAVMALPQTTLSQPVTQISGVENLLGDYFASYQENGFQSYAEIPFEMVQLDRINRCLSHLLARYAETTLDANLLQYDSVIEFYVSALQRSAPPGVDATDLAFLTKRLVMLKQATDKTVLLGDYPRLSRLRTGGFHYLSGEPRQHFVTSLSHRILRFLGVYNTQTMPLATTNREGIYLLEGALLWAGHSDADPVEKRTLYFVLPDWPTRFYHTGFRELLEQQLLRESPVHQTVNVIYLGRETMSKFEQLYFAWLNAMTQCPLTVRYAGDIISPDESEAENWLISLSTQLRQFLKTPENIEFLPSFYHEGISDAAISEDFRVDYAPLAFLRTNYAIGTAAINPENGDSAAFSVNINIPNRIEEPL